MKIIITEEQYGHLVTNLLDLLLGNITIKTVKEKKEDGNKEDYHSVFNEDGETVMTIWVKGPLRSKGCKKDLTLENSLIEKFEQYMPHYKHKMFSKVLVNYIYDKFGIKCDCVQYDYNFEEEKYVDDDDDELEEYFGTTVIDDDEIEDSLGGGAKIFIQEVYVKFYINNKLVSPPSIYFITKNNKVIGVSSHSRFTDIATSFRYIPYKILNSYFIERAKTYLEEVLSDGNYLNESVEGKSSLENLIYEFLNDDFYPDYNWGPELFDFYREDVKEHGVIPFYINDSEAYVYYDDGTLEIMPWVCEKLNEYFNDLWYSVFKSWFEENSGLKVSMMVDSRNNNRLLQESIDNSNVVEQIMEVEGVKYDGCGYGGRTYDNFGRRHDTVEVYFKLPDEEKLYSRRIHFFTRNNKVVSVDSTGDFRTITDGFRYIPTDILMGYFIEKSKTYIERILHKLYPNDSR